MIDSNEGKTSIPPRHQKASISILMEVEMHSFCLLIHRPF